MKNSIYLLALIVFSTLILANAPVQTATRFIMTVVGDEPTLPAIPYGYNQVDIPEHLKMENNDSIGYAAGGVDTTVFPLINNNAATLGRVLFYDKTLSTTEDISCGSCHQQALSFADDVIQSQGTNMATMRNSMQLNDLGWTNSEHFGWDVKHKILEDILAVPFLDENELGINAEDLMLKLNSSTFYPQLFQNAFGPQDIELSMVITALADFIKSMNTFNSRLDESLSDETVNLNESEMRGSAIFAADCATCHFQGSFPLFPLIDLGIPVIDMFPDLLNNGLPIITGDIGAGEWDPTLVGIFKPPTLRNIEVTGPYMHDGRFETLDEVIDHYSEGIQQNQWTMTGISSLVNFEYTDLEKADLKAFLLTLTDESFLTNPKWSDPFEGTVTSNNNLTIESVVLKPNPMSQVATISFNNTTNEIVDITIHSNDGKLIRQDRVQGNEYVIQKKNFIPGLYYVKLVMGNKTSTQKLMVQ